MDCLPILEKIGKKHNISNILLYNAYRKFNRAQSTIYRCFRTFPPKRLEETDVIIFGYLSASLFAGVNLKNGNFYISYTDIIVPGGGKNLKISRTYNSKSVAKGWFGFGWGSNFETKLWVSADGSVIVRENGSGAVTRFTPKSDVNV